MIAGLAALLAWWLQGEPPQVRASVDRDRVTVGDAVTYTVQAVSRSTAPIRISVEPPAGLQLVARTERSEVSQIGGPSRTTVLELQLRALRAGRWQFAPARAVQGSATGLSAAVELQVDELPGAAMIAANPTLKRLLERAPLPGRAGQPAVGVLLSANSALVGEQVDVLTAAWFPRELRVRLRRPPTLQPPVIEGVWSYPQPVPPGIAATRNVGGTLYDLFVAHQVVFPLVAGRIVVPPAVLKYSVPVALQFFSQEERYTLTSSSETLEVAPIPPAGRPAGYAGAVGSGLRLERAVTPDRARTGEPVSVSFTLTGEGNPALWPAPDLRWPAGVRAYPDRTDERLFITGGRLGGAKTFAFTVVPDSAGRIPLPGAAYGYYDVAARGFRVATLSPDRLPVAPGPEARASRPLPPPLRPAEGPPLGWRIVHAGGPWPLAVAFGMPPLLWLALRRRPRLRHRRGAAVPAPPGVEGELEDTIRRLVPAEDLHSEASLIAALRTAGVEPALAARLARARRTLQELRYGPGAGPVPPELAAELRRLIAQVVPSRRAAGGMRGAAAVLPLALLLGGPARAQGPAPERLYERGALQAAAAAFAARTRAEPADPAHWYNLGATYYRLGLDGRAAAAWLQAARLAPRDRTVRRALELVPAPDAASAGRLWVPPVTWEELLVGALPLWIAGWIALARPRRRDLGLAAIGLAALAGGGAVALRSRETRPVAVLLGKTPLQLSPHERAPTIAPLEPGSALVVVRRGAGWVMAAAPDGRLGWIPADSLFVLRES